MAANYLYPLSIGAALAAGVGATVNGIKNVCNGNILTGVKRACFGWAAINVGGLALNSSQRDGLLQASLLVSAVSVASQGVEDLKQGIKERGLGRSLKGAVWSTLGFAGTVAAVNLDSKTLEVINQAALLAMAGGVIARSGVKDIENGAYWKGAGKMVLGAGGVICAGYYAFDVLFGKDREKPAPTYEENPPEEFRLFLEKHRDEVDSIYKTNVETGEWNQLGEGGCKISFSHPEMPHHVIKFPLSNPEYCQDPQGEMLTQFKNIQNAKKIFAENNYQHLILPDSYLASTEKGPILFETKFDFVNNRVNNANAESELDDFINEGQFCDIDIDYGHNAKFLKGSGAEPKIGIFDLDCGGGGIRRKSILKWLLGQ